MVNQTGKTQDAQINENVDKKFNMDFLDIKTLGPVIGLLLISAIYAVLSPYFLTWLNFVNILRQSSIIGVMAIGVTFVIICAEIDLSLANIMAFSGIVAAAVSSGGYMISHSYHPLLAILCGLIVGGLLGCISGFAVAKLNIPSFMSTLSMMFVAEGLTLWFTDAQPLYGLPDQILWLGEGSLFGIPSIVLTFLIVFFVAHIVLSRTVFGRNIYAIGGNEEAARMSGINVGKYKVLVLVISGALSALAGIMMLGRVGSAQVTAGVGLMMPPIASVILGGTSLFGGEGNLFRTLLGVLLMGVLVNGLNLLGVGSDGQKLATGIVLLVAVGFNVLGSKKQ